MKELSVEEKAKLYDEAKARMSRAYNDNRCTIGFMNEIFPELKESEDEGIMKSLKILLQHFCNGYRVPGLDFPVSYKDMLAWLEKQGEKDLVTCPICGWEIKKQGEQKSLDDIAKEVTKDKDAAISFLKSTGIINENGELADEYKIEQGEQNPVWSEEDEDYYDAIIAKLEVTQDDALLTDNQIKFLKSLKDRVHPQPKQEWSEEDERLRRKLIELIYAASYCDERENLSDWLKSLKDRYTWKPSDEQMEGIECTIKTLRYQLNAGDNRLDSLYNDLKKLRKG